MPNLGFPTVGKKIQSLISGIWTEFGQRLPEIFRKEILSVENSGTEASKATETGHKH